MVYSSNQLSVPEAAVEENCYRINERYLKKKRTFNKTGLAGRDVSRKPLQLHE